MKSIGQSRIPRPMGLTFMALEFQKFGTEEHKEKVYQHFINHYVLSGFQLGKKHVNIYDLAKIINLAPDRIMAMMRKISSNLSDFNDPEKTRELLQTITTLSMSWAIEDRGRISNQVELLTESQKGTYKPFISDTLSKTLKISLESNKNMMEVFRTFFQSQSPTTQIFNLIPQKQEDKNQVEMLTQSQALELIHKTNTNIHSLPSSTSNISNTNEQLNSIYNEHLIGIPQGLFKNPLNPTATEPNGLILHDSSFEALSQNGPETDPKTEPQPHKAKKPNSHKAFNSRRGLDVVDTDNLP
jgi:hypothetical protein